MSIIVPTITTDNLDDYKEQIIKLNNFATRVQVDVSDGEFTPDKLLNETQVWWPEDWEVDIHMMVKKPSDHLDNIFKIKPHLVIFHAEVEEDLTSLLSLLKKSDINVGVALLRPTFPGHIANYIEVVDHVMIFSGILGKQGGKANLMQLEKIRLIKEINPTVEIGWDGGINLGNAFNISQGGVDVLNVGSAITNSDRPDYVYKQMTAEINKHGVI